MATMTRLGQFPLVTIFRRARSAGGSAGSNEKAVFGAPKGALDGAIDRVFL
jgi:hypothetical protein